MGWWRFWRRSKKPMGLRPKPLLALLEEVGAAMGRAQASRVRRIDVAGLICQRVVLFIEESDLPSDEKANILNVCISTLERAASKTDKS